MCSANIPKPPPQIIPPPPPPQIVTPQSAADTQLAPRRAGGSQQPQGVNALRIDLTRPYPPVGNGLQIPR